MKHLLLSIGLFSAAFFPMTSQATEYFVSPRGNDSSDGKSTSAAFATIQKGMDGLQPGDTLTLLPGEYFGVAKSGISGTPDAPITIRAQRRGTVLIRGDVDAPKFEKAKNLRYTYVTPFQQRVEGVVERNSKYVYEPKTVLADVELNLATYIQDEKNGLLYVHTSNSEPPDTQALAISVTNDNGILLTPNVAKGEKFVHDVILDGLAFTGYNSREFPTGPGSRNRWGLHIISPQHVTVRRCTAFLNSGGIFLLLGDGATVEDCYCFANHSRFVGFGNNLLGWASKHYNFLRNRAESITLQDQGTSREDLTLYSSMFECVVRYNIAINAGIMLKGTDAEASVQADNISVGKGAYFYNPPNETNLLLPNYLTSAALQKYADPVHFDFRLQIPDGDETAKAEIFYVSPDGNDKDTGTALTNAWKTLAHAAKTVKAGQTIYITAGNYNETLVPAASGTKDKSIRFIRYGHDRVVLNGENKLPLGIDLKGRENIEIDGLEITGFTTAGLNADKSANIEIVRCILANNTVGLTASGSQSLMVRNDLFRNYARAGAELQKCTQATLTGNIFDTGKGPAIRCDKTSLESLCSDYNDFVPAASVAQLDAQALKTLDDWRKASSLDTRSLSVQPEYGNVAAGDYSLPQGSVLGGRGPLADIIGPYNRIADNQPLKVVDPVIHSVTATTANLEWWSPARAAGMTLFWGTTPKCENSAPTTSDIFHTFSLIGLKPGTSYYFCVASKEKDRTYRWAPFENPVDPTVSDTGTLDASDGMPQPPVAFRTLADEQSPRTLHVSTTGNDANDGLSSNTAWRTITHAGKEVRAGDSVFIHGGQYQETAFIRGTGDEKRPVTIQAAPGEEVWIDGDNRNLCTAFLIRSKYYLHFDGLHFRNFAQVDHGGDTFNMENGGHITISRCFYDGRISNGYTGQFIRATGVENILVENCVIICGMGAGVDMMYCPESVVRNTVFYNNYIRAIDASASFTASHNLYCDLIMGKANAFYRIKSEDAVQSDYNGYFTRFLNPEERSIIEINTVGNGKLEQKKLNMAAWRSLSGQDRNTIMGNPNIPVAPQLVPEGGTEAEWNKVELHWDPVNKSYAPLDFKDFYTDPNGPMGKAADGKPIGLDPAAFNTNG